MQKPEHPPGLMCGLFGLIRHTRPVSDSDYNRVDRALNAMKYRGPDHTGLNRVTENAIIGCNRLRITDHLNEAADMPLNTADGRLSIVHNGEIYNHMALRAGCGNFAFQTKSDTETIMACYRKDGRDCVHSFEGMYAFCLYDRTDDRFVFAVDPSGQKQLYYIHDETGLWFSSEIAPLLEVYDGALTWNRPAIAEFIAQRWIHGNETHINEIRRLEPGHVMVVTGEGRIDQERFYNLPLGRQDRGDVEAITDDIHAAVDESCHRTFNLEVPAALFLSGGIDSTTILMKSLEAGQDLSTYSIGFKPMKGETYGYDFPFDEFEYSRYLADRYTLDHHEIVLGPDDYFSYQDKWLATCDELLESSEAPCLMKLFETVRSHGKRAVLCGSGPDEVFDGYGQGYAARDWPADDFAGRYYERFNFSDAVDFQKLIPGEDPKSRFREQAHRYLSRHPEIINPVQKVQILNYYARCQLYEYRQMDFASMRHAIEVRTPMADQAVTRAAFDFDPALKCHDGEEKWIFKQAMKKVVPEKIALREKKGFLIPMPIWFSGPFEERVRSIFDPGSALNRLGILDMAYLESCFAKRDPAYRLIFLRLYSAEIILRRHNQYISQPDIS